MKNLLKNNLSFFVPFILMWLVCLGWVLQTPKFEQMVWINSHRTIWSDTFFWCATQLGEGWFFVTMILVWLVFKYEQAFIGVTAFAVSTLISQGLKFSFQTLRPSEFFKDVSYPWKYVSGVELHGFNSFPSGHTTSAFCIFTLWVFFAKKPMINPIFLTLAITAAYSRPYLFQHFPEDLLGGSIVGIISAILAIKIYQRYFETKYPQLSQKGLLVNRH
ncbi:phosphatase PAP2 family protein [Flectobacillus roseus]|uniref:Phosphatase PAP2 family protein n=1 Tax=Flectobacillus roseus TaxID=502259 RepID=A0ABT6YBZ9_9BACT|nr:phosphatase PAP2 family protein [Flectobacillus roseus]MDI9860967.1 phosphatase PAP2 family protein [Flectobacillus roseus]